MAVKGNTLFRETWHQADYAADIWWSVKTPILSRRDDGTG
jgi:hypothetical protein